jgi:hypothetical protein
MRSWWRRPWRSWPQREAPPSGGTPRPGACCAPRPCQPLAAPPLRCLAGWGVPGGPRADARLTPPPPLQARRRAGSAGQEPGCQVAQHRGAAAPAHGLGPHAVGGTGRRRWLHRAAGCRNRGACRHAQSVGCVLLPLPLCAGTSCWGGSRLQRATLRSRRWARVQATCSGAVWCPHQACAQPTGCPRCPLPPRCRLACSACPLPCSSRLQQKRRRAAGAAAGRGRLRDSASGGGAPAVQAAAAQARTVQAAGARRATGRGMAARRSAAVRGAGRGQGPPPRWTTLRTSFPRASGQPGVVWGPGR